MRREVDKSILSTPALRMNLFRILTLMEDTELAIQYHHHGQIMILKAYKTHRKYKRTRKSNKDINPLSIITSKCELCSGLMLSNICVNSDCQNSRPAVSTTSGVL